VELEGGGLAPEVNSRAGRIVAVLATVIVVAAAIALYVSKMLLDQPAVSATATGPGQAELTLATTPAVGKLGGNPPWVSYLVREDDKWVHRTNYNLPANSTVRITIHQYDSATGLRNPFLAHVQGTVGGTMEVDGKTVSEIDPASTSHTFTVPEMGISVPLPGVPEKAQNQCSEMPCSLSQAHETVSFVIRTGKKGRYRFQCFVPCAAGFIDGNGGPMQTVGYMDGFITVA
jgi:hypothetical protein